MTDVLNLNTLIADGPTVGIDGVSYPLRRLEACGLLDYHRAKSIGARCQALWQKPELTSDEERELASLLDRMCRLILEAPDEVHAKLTDIQRASICQVFSQLPANGSRPAEEAIAGEPATTNPTGA